MPSSIAEQKTGLLRILLVAPSPPPYGGMALQASLLNRRLGQDGQFVDFFPSNFPLPSWTGPAGRIPGVRTLLRAVLIGPKLWRRIRNADIVHIFAASWLYFFVVVCPAVIVGRLCGTRTVVNYRGGEAGKFFDRFGLFAFPIVKMASVVVCPSRFLGDLIGSRFGIPVAIVRNIVDLSRFRFRERRVFAPSLLVTRHLEAMYDVESVLRAFARVQSRFPEASLSIAGEGSQEACLRTLSEQLGLNHVRFLGHVPHERLPELYASCDIYINASRVDNFPGALVEAAAAGLAVVTTGAGGIPWMFENERTALMVAVGDWEALACAVERVVNNPGDAVAMTRLAASEAAACEWSEVRSALYQAYGVPALGDSPAIERQQVSAS